MTCYAEKPLNPMEDQIMASNDKPNTAPRGLLARMSDALDSTLSFIPTPYTQNMQAHEARLAELRAQHERDGHDYVTSDGGGVMRMVCHECKAMFKTKIVRTHCKACAHRERDKVRAQRERGEQVHKDYLDKVAEHSRLAQRAQDNAIMPDAKFKALTRQESEEWNKIVSDHNERWAGSLRSDAPEPRSADLNTVYFESARKVEEGSTHDSGHRMSLKERRELLRSKGLLRKPPREAHKTIQAGPRDYITGLEAGDAIMQMECHECKNMFHTNRPHTHCAVCASEEPHTPSNPFDRTGGHGPDGLEEPNAFDLINERNRSGDMKVDETVYRRICQECGGWFLGNLRHERCDRHKRNDIDIVSGALNHHGTRTGRIDVHGRPKDTTGGHDVLEDTDPFNHSDGTGEERVKTFLGFRIVEDDSVPEDEIHVKRARGFGWIIKRGFNEQT